MAVIEQNKIADIESPSANNGKRSSKSKKSAKQNQLISNDIANKVPFSIVEAYKGIRIQIISALEKIRGQILLISSPNASEGKSTTSANIAITLSQLNKKILLIDADFRRPSIHKKLKIENKCGLYDVLTDKKEFEDAVIHHMPFLDVLTPGIDSANPSEMFSSPAFDKLLSDLKSIYDYVIIDTPPINIVSDTLVLSQKCDALLLVVRSAVTTYDVFKHALATIRQLNINLIGTVINGTNPNKKRYYSKYNYRYGGYYGNKR